MARMERTDPRCPKEIEQLALEIQQDERKYIASRLIEQGIMATVSERDFAPAIQRTRLLANQRALAERIRRNKIMLAWAQA